MSLSNGRCKIKVKNQSEATRKDICDFIKPEVCKKRDIIVFHAGTNGITSNTKTFICYEKITDTTKSKLPNCKYAISNVIIRKEKPDIQRKVIYFNSRLSKFCSKNKIDVIENKNLDGSCLIFKILYINKKSNSYLVNSYFIFFALILIWKSLASFS